MSINSSGIADVTRLDIDGITVVDTNRDITCNSLDIPAISATNISCSQKPKLDNRYLPLIGSDNTSFPIGIYLVINSNGLTRNQSTDVYMTGDSSYSSVNTTGSTKLDGVWRSRGFITSSLVNPLYLVQRTE